MAGWEGWEASGGQEEGRRPWGEGPGKSGENARLQEAPSSDNLLLGLPLSPRDSRRTSWDHPSRASQPGAQRLITRGLHGPIKQMMTIPGRLPLLEEETAAPWGRAQATDPVRSSVRRQPRPFTEVEIEAGSSRVRDVPGSRMSWHCSRMRSQVSCLPASYTTLLPSTRRWRNGSLSSDSMR